MVFLRESVAINEYHDTRHDSTDLKRHLKNRNKKASGEDDEQTHSTFSGESSSSDPVETTRSSQYTSGLFAPFSNNAGLKIKEIEKVQNKVHETTKTLKRQVKDFDKAIDLESGSPNALSPAALNISKRKVHQLEAERRRTMNAVEYLQEVEIDLNSSMERAREALSNKTRCKFDVPCLFEIMARVQTILSAKIAYYEPGLATASIKISKDGWYLDDPHKQTRKLTLADAGISVYQRQSQGFTAPKMEAPTRTVSANGDPSRQTTTTMSQRSFLIRSSSQGSRAPARGMLKHESNTKKFQAVKEESFLNLIGP